MTTVMLRTEEDTEAAGALVAQACQPGDFIALEGDLGAGKTCFVKGLARALGCPDEVTSPTFALIHRYTIDPPFDELAHVDLYRLESEEDLESTGYWDVVQEAGITVVEWIQRLPGAVAHRRAWWIRLAHEGAWRSIEVVQGPSERAAACIEAMQTRFGR